MSQYSQFRRRLKVDRMRRLGSGQNLLLQSNTFETSWTLVNASVAQKSVADAYGETLGCALSEDDTAAANHGISQAVTVAVGDTLILSAEVKAVNRSFLDLAIIQSTNNGFQFFNLSTQAAGAHGDGVEETWVQDMGNGYYRYSIRVTATQTSVTCRIYIAEADNDFTFSGLNQVSLHIARAQLSKDRWPIAYVETTTAAVVP